MPVRTVFLRLPSPPSIRPFKKCRAVIKSKIPCIFLKENVLPAKSSKVKTADPKCHQLTIKRISISPSSEVPDPRTPLIIALGGWVPAHDFVALWASQEAMPLFAFGALLLMTSTRSPHDLHKPGCSVEDPHIGSSLLHIRLER